MFYKTNSIRLTTSSKQRTKDTSFYKEEKDSLESIANIIKQYQLEYFTSNNEKGSSEKKREILISILKVIQKDLIFQVKEQNKKKEDIYNKVKIYIIYYSKLFSSNKEVEQLKELNFLIINKIDELDFLIKTIKQKIFSMKSFSFLGEDSRERYFINNQDLNEEFSERRNQIKEYQSQAMRLRTLQKEELDYLRTQIIKTKDICESKNFRKKYINTTDIIEEDDRDNKDITESSIRKNSNYLYNPLILLKKKNSTVSKSSFAIPKVKPLQDNSIENIQDGRVNSNHNREIEIII